MNKQAILKREWILKTIDKAHDQGLIVNPDMIVSEFNIPSADAILILNDWFCERLASLIQGASK